MRPPARITTCRSFLYRLLGMSGPDPIGIPVVGRRRRYPLITRATSSPGSAWSPDRGDSFEVISEGVLSRHLR